LERLKQKPFNMAKQEKQVSEAALKARERRAREKAEREAAKNKENENVSDPNLVQGEIGAGVSNSDESENPPPPVPKQKSSPKKDAQIEQEPGFVYAERNGVTRRFSEATWNQMQSGRDGWKRIVKVPEEVQSL
jgi:hypothetical protein